jgi:hypothetical protein
MTSTPASPNNAAANSNTQQRPNPFGSRATNSSFTPRQQQTQPAAAPATTPATPPAAGQQGGSLLRRPFGNQQETLHWTVSPLSKTGVRFQLGGLGDPFHRLLGMPLNTEYGNPVNVIKALQDDDELREKLETLLETSWASYGFRGAAMLFPWDAEVRKAFTRSPQPDQPPAANNQNAKEDADDDSWLDDLAAPTTARSCECVRAIDLPLVLNILARSRTQILVEGTPLALEPGFLDQVYVTDDPRLVALAQATGCIEEVW